MAEETGQQPESGQAEVSKGVTTDDLGLPDVSADELLDAVGLTDEKEPEPEREKQPAPDRPPEKPKEDKPEVTKRKIKWQGQEVELDPDKEVEFIQKGFDYTQKMQQLAEERNQLTPHLGVVKAIQNDPALRQKIAEHLIGGQAGQQPVQQQPPKFDDPIEQLKWETKQEVMWEVEQKIARPMQEQNAALTHQQLLSQVASKVQTDPLYTDVQAALHHEVRSLPPSVAQNVYMQYDQNPRAYLEAYQLARQRVIAAKQQTQAPKGQTPMPEPVKREEHAPILEGAKNAPTEAEVGKRNESLKALNKRARAGDYRALGELLLKGEMLKGIVD